MRGSKMMNDTLDMFYELGMVVNWGTVYAGRTLGLIGLDEVTKYATKRLEQHPDIDDQAVIDLAWGDEEAAMDQLLKEQMSTDSPTLEYETDKWRYAKLHQLIRTNSNHTVLLEQVAQVYADFNYPDDMECLIYYMDQRDEEYDPAQHSKEKNEWRLIDRLEKLLETERQKFILVDPELFTG
jgi:hypothetical protein